MESSEFIFCKWNGRFWPAKVLTTCKETLSGNDRLEVEIFDVREQASVHFNNTRPFQMGELEYISNELDRSENLIVTVEELKHRAALRTAMDILKEPSTKVPKITNVLTDDTSLHTSEVHKEEEKHAEVIKPVRKRFQEKDILNSDIAGVNKSTLKGKKRLNTNGTAKSTKCPWDLRVKNGQSDNLAVGKDKELKHTADRKNRKRTKDMGAEQDSISCKKSRTQKTIPQSSLTTEERMSEKNTDPCNLKKVKGTRNQLKNSSLTEIEKCLAVSPDKDDAGKAKTSGKPEQSSKQKNKSRIVSHSSTSTDESNPVKRKVTKNSIGKSLSTENKGHSVLSPDPVKNVTGNDITSKQNILSDERKPKPRTVSSSSATIDESKSEKRKVTKKRIGKSLSTENKGDSGLSPDPKPKTRTVSSSSATTDESKSEKCKVTKNSIVKSLSTENKGDSVVLPDPKPKPRTVSSSSATTDESKSEKRKVTKNHIGKSLSTENKGYSVLSPDPKPKPRTKSSSSTTTDLQKPGKCSGIRNRFNKSFTTENKEHCIMSDPNEDDLGKEREHSNRQKLGPKRKGVAQPATKVLQGGPTDSENDSQTKGKFNHISLPEFSFGCETDFFPSDLSEGLSSPESSAVQVIWPQDDTEEDIQLPVLNFQKEPPSFERADFVWCKFHRYPYWPSLVKSVSSKEKRATIIFVEECLSDPNCKKQSFQVAIRTLKHYDCPEKQELLGIARKDYGKSIDWCDALICDYRIRLGCGSFSGSFLEYCTAAISYPVRRECNNIKLSFPLLIPIKAPAQNLDTNSQVNNKMLPDRSRASRDKANEKLVECIVKAQQVDTHLIDILKGKKSSSWLKRLQAFNRGVDCLETYLEDEGQIELVVNYLYALCDKMHSEAKKLMNGDPAKFILEVMLPEAVVCAIAITNGVSYEKAKKTFLEGPLLSRRERKLFEKQILEKKAAKLQKQT